MYEKIHNHLNLTNKFSKRVLKHFIFLRNKIYIYYIGFNEINCFIALSTFLIFHDLGFGQKTFLYQKYFKF